MATTDLQSLRKWQPFYPSLLWAYAGRVHGRHLMAMRANRITAWLITRGHVRLISDETELQVRRGSWVFFCSNFQEHNFSPAAEIVSVSLSVPEAIKSMWQHAPLTFKADKHPELAETARKLIALIDADNPDRPIGPHLPDHQMDLEQSLRIAALGLEWSAVYLAARNAEGMAIEAPARQGHPKVTYALTLLVAESLDHKFSETRLATKVGLSTGHLNQLFVRELGMTPRRYWEQQRRETAHRRVRHSEASFKQIAYELGFNSPSHFSNWFQRTFHCTPRYWRQHGKPKVSTMP